MNNQRLDLYRQLHEHFGNGDDQNVLGNLVEQSFFLNIPLVDLDVALFLTVLLRLRPAKRILELGTGIGYSSLLFSLSCPDAEVITIETDPKCCAVARTMFDRSSARERIQLVNLDISDALRSSFGTFDFVFIDAAKESYMNYFSEIMDYLTDDAVVITDDIFFTGVIQGSVLPGIDPERIKTSLADYRTFLRNQKEFLTTFISVGCGVGLSVRSRMQN